MFVNFFICKMKFVNLTSLETDLLLEVSNKYSCVISNFILLVLFKNSSELGS